MVMFKIQKLLQPFILSGVLCIGQYARAEEDVSRFVTIIDGASNPAAAPAAPTASPPTDAPTSTAKSSNPSIESGQNPAVSSTERLQSEPIISPSTPKSVNSANLDTQSPIKIANTAELSVEMLPGKSVSIGSQVSFRIKSKKAGYVVLIDIDANGKLTQIFPTVASLTRNFRPNANYIKPGAPLLVPNLANAEGMAYVVSPPAGKAMVVAMWSEQAVQILDLPDIPPEMAGQDEALTYLAKWASQLRIPESTTNRLHEAKWSFDAKTYSIQ
jgi:Domain of unknown function (DUF4384)